MIQDLQIFNTLQLKELLESGHRIDLPDVCIADEHQHLYGASPDNTDNPIVSIECIGEDEVQCIRVEDEDHLYITDDLIPTHNTSNIVFLKSTDDSMLDTLQKMSGITHKSFVDSKTVTVNNTRLIMRNEDTVSYTATTKEVPVISYNDMAFISERNSIVFRAGDAPIWNRNETILPMSWRLFSNTIEHAGHEYSLQTIPTLSSALDFDLRKNQPDFLRMLDVRMEQAYFADEAKRMYAQAYGYGDYELSQLDPDVYSDDIMDIINNLIRQKKMAESDGEFDDSDWDTVSPELESQVEVNTEQLEANAEAQAIMDTAKERRYAGGTLSREDLVALAGGVNHQYDEDFVETFKELKQYLWKDSEYFSEKNGELWNADGTICYIKLTDESAEIKALQEDAESEDKRVYAEEKPEAKDFSAYIVQDAFYKFLVQFDSWPFANGRFNTLMQNNMTNR